MSWKTRFPAFCAWSGWWNTLCPTRTASTGSSRICFRISSIAPQARCIPCAYRKRPCIWMPCLAAKPWWAALCRAWVTAIWQCFLWTVCHRNRTRPYCVIWMLWPSSIVSVVALSAWISMTRPRRSTLTARAGGSRFSAFWISSSTTPTPAPTVTLCSWPKTRKPRSRKCKVAT